MTRSAVLVILAVLTLPCAACEALKRPRPAPVRLESVSEATQHYEAKRLEFKGTARPELAGVHSWRNRSSGRGNSSALGNPLYMHVVPVVPEGWTRDDPVPLWVSGDKLDEDPSAWTQSLSALATDFTVGKVVDYAGREKGFRTTSGWQKAIANAEQTHGITSDPHAPILVWPDPGT